MKARVQRTMLVCDEAGCGWCKRVDFPDVPKFHKEPCPKCGKGEIISDADLAAFGLIDSLVKLSNAIDPEGKLPQATMNFNTAPLREKGTA